MVSISRSSIIGLAVMLLVAVPAFVLAYNAQAIETAELNSISRGCSAIKQTLSQLQYADLRTRTYLGSTYESIANNYVIPLNLRLVKLNQPDPELLAIQADFTDLQVKFRSIYTEYMRELDGLINIDCSSRPEDFYKQLEVVRAHRSDLHEATARLSELVDRQYAAVAALKEKLSNGS